jgi:hypothetical protein
MVDLTGVFELRLDAALEDVGDGAKKLAIGEGRAIGAAAQMVDVSMLERPDADALALWLAATVLAHHLKSPAPVSLNAGQIRHSDLRTPADARLTSARRFAPNAPTNLFSQSSLRASHRRSTPAAAREGIRSTTETSVQDWKESRGACGMKSATAISADIMSDGRRGTREKAHRSITPPTSSMTLAKRKWRKQSESIEHRNTWKMQEHVQAAPQEQQRRHNAKRPGRKGSFEIIPSATLGETTRASRRRERRGLT